MNNVAGFSSTDETTEYFKINIGTNNSCLLTTRGGESWLFTSIALSDDSNISAAKLGGGFDKIGGIKAKGTTIYFFCLSWGVSFIVTELVNNIGVPDIIPISATEYNSI